MIEAGGVLPPGWAWTTLADIADVAGGITKDAARQNDPMFVEVPYLRVANVQRGFLDLREVARIRVSPEKAKALELRPGDVLFNEGGDRDKLGRGWVWTGGIPGCIHQNHVFRARLRSDEIDPRYVSWYGNEEGRSFFEAHGKQTTNLASISMTNLKRLPLPLPPAAEQKRIVAAIDEHFSHLDAGAAALERAQRNLKRIRAAVLQAAVEGRLSTDRIVEDGSLLVKRIREDREANRGKLAGKRSSPRPVEPSDDLPRLPEGWSWASLDQLGQEGRPIIYGIIKPGPHIPDGVPYVRVTEMKNGFVDVPNLRRTSEERASKFTRATLKAGDVLVSKDGTIGRVAVVPPELEGGNITQHVMRAGVHSFMNRDFVVIALRSPQAQRWLRGEVRGVALQGINVEDFRRLPIPVPPVEEQELIVAEVERYASVLDSLDGIIGTCLGRSEALRRAVLQAAFRGRLVPQDPADEPASMMLERVTDTRRPTEASTRRAQNRKAL